jgi:hygromycin-B 4-O-kinase
MWLVGTFGGDVDSVELIGAGEWSECFGFRNGQRDLVARFGRHLDDFVKDRFATSMATDGLAIPETVLIDRAFDGYVSVATRAFGVPLESISEHHWRQLLPAVVGVVEALRNAVLPATGWGEFDGHGHAPMPSWRDWLLAVGDRALYPRVDGWRTTMQRWSGADTTFRRAYDLMSELAPDGVPKSCLHLDMTHRNVHILDDKITGVFDWGCAAYGDHLYDLARFEFWEPWHPNLAAAELLVAVRERWRRSGYQPHDVERRWKVCHLHNGLMHLAYNAYLGDRGSFDAIAGRMGELVSALR